MESSNCYLEEKPVHTNLALQKLSDEMVGRVLQGTATLLFLSDEESEVGNCTDLNSPIQTAWNLKVHSRDRI